MGKFHFDQQLVKSAESKLKEISDLLAQGRQNAERIKNELNGNKGFGIEQIIDDMTLQSSKFIDLEEKLTLGITILDNVQRSVSSYAESALKAGETASVAAGAAAAGVSTGADAINTVIANGNVGSSDNTWVGTDGIKYYKDEFGRKSYTGDDGHQRTIFDGRSTLVHDSMGEGSLYLEYDFGQGKGRGYLQDPGTGEWWYGRKGVNGGVECVATAAANTSAINGVLVDPSFYNTVSNNHTNVSNHTFRLSSEDITMYTVRRLHKGYATEIYYDYNNCDYGHALTVVGARPNASSIYDLRVLDPSSGTEKWFEEVVKGINKGDSGNYYVCTTYGTFADNSAMMNESDYWNVWNDEAYWLDLGNTSNRK